MRVAAIGTGAPRTACSSATRRASAGPGPNGSSGCSSSGTQSNATGPGKTVGSGGSSWLKSATTSRSSVRMPARPTPEAASRLVPWTRARPKRACSGASASAHASAGPGGLTTRGRRRSSRGGARSAAATGTSGTPAIAPERSMQGTCASSARFTQGAAASGGTHRNATSAPRSGTSPASTGRLSPRTLTSSPSEASVATGTSSAIG